MSVSLLPQDHGICLTPSSLSTSISICWLRERERARTERRNRERKKRGEREGGREWGQDRGGRNGIWLSGGPEMLRSRLGQVGILAINTSLK